MDEMMVRSRYPRHSVPNRRKRRSTNESNTMMDKIMRQTIICILILVALSMIKNINTPFTNFLTEKARAGLSRNYDLKNAYNTINGIFDKEAKKAESDDDKGDDVPESGVLPARTKEYDSDPSLEGETYEGVEEDWFVQDAALVGDIKKKFSFKLPVEGVLSSPFGNRYSSLRAAAQFHEGIDIEAEHGAEIQAALAGEVIEAGNVPSYGNYIKIKHEDGLATLYAHCSELTVKKGQKVKQGEIIARVGNTGASVGAHLHFEIRKDGKPLNPEDFIEVPEY